jgi:hypothetical protein
VGNGSKRGGYGEQFLVRTEEMRAGVVVGLGFAAMEGWECLQAQMVLMLCMVNGTLLGRMRD